MIRRGGDKYYKSGFPAGWHVKETFNGGSILCHGTFDPPYVAVAKKPKGVGYADWRDLAKIMAHALEKSGVLS